MGVGATPEVYGLFAPLLPQVARDHYDQLPKRKRQGIVPDMRVTCRQQAAGPMQSVLVELKTLHYAPTTYPTCEERCAAVERRAGRIGAEYLGRARALDRRWHHTLPDSQGPIETRLRTYGEVRGLVFGSWGEASPDVSWLLAEAADIGVSRSRAFCPADDEDAPNALKAKFAGTLRRRWGMMALRANARLLLERLSFVGGGAVRAHSRRAAGRLLHLARARLGPRVWPVRM